MDRRKFLLQTSASLVIVGLFRHSFAEQGEFPVEVTLRVNAPAAQTATMPEDFLGLSYESAQLTNPDFFAATNTGLVKRFLGLSTQGVLRLGGDLSDVTEWSDLNTPPPTTAQLVVIDAWKSGFEWVLVDPVAAKGRVGVITPSAIAALRTFLDATGWKLIYGLNFGTGTPERAAVEAACVQEAIGPHLIAFQVGNEANEYGTHNDMLRPKPLTFDEYWAEYQGFVKAVRQRTPQARFAGPDTDAEAIDWVEGYAQKAKADAVLITSHYYAIGPARNPHMATQHLLHPPRRLMKDTYTSPGLEAAKTAGVPYRMTEGNSCSHGGQPNVSDAFVSALWCADYMLFVAKAGYSGVNMHGGGNGLYSPIVGDAQIGFTARPIYYGMQFAQQFVGYSFLESDLDAKGTNMTAYLARNGRGDVLLAVLNKDHRAVTISLDGEHSDIGSPKQVWQLTAPSLDSKTDVTFAEVDILDQHVLHRRQHAFVVAPYSGILVRFESA